LSPTLGAALLAAGIFSVYHYALYPALLLLLRRMGGSVHPAPEPGEGGPPRPTVSLVVAARNEEARIVPKLEDLAALDYPGLQVLVVSDASDDDTDRLVQTFCAARDGDEATPGQGAGVPSFQLVRSPTRKGKEHAQLLGILEATGSILVFTDVGTRIPPDGIRRIVSRFRDPEVGAVSSEDRFLSADGALVGEGLYVRYEMAIRRLESDLAGLVGLSGSYFAARREVCEDWDTEAPSDFVTALNCSRRGLRAVTAPDVHGFYQDLEDPKAEYRRKVRTVLRGMTALARHREALRPSRGLFAFQVWSHKVMRWTTPVFLLVLLGLSIVAAYRDPRGWMILLPQLAFYGGAAAAWLLPPARGLPPLRIAHYFCLANVAILHAMTLFLSGRRMTTWSPSKRAS
jgi:cellulose synthase/poly-beta-1,6-N-acetylglucosamine synthase-like glycosyltransferase